MVFKSDNASHLPSHPSKPAKRPISSTFTPTSFTLRRIFNLLLLGQKQLLIVFVHWRRDKSGPDEEYHDCNGDHCKGAYADSDCLKDLKNILHDIFLPLNQKRAPATALNSPHPSLVKENVSSSSDL